jgi:hypothetical protein
MVGDLTLVMEDRTILGIPPEELLAYKPGHPAILVESECRRPEPSKITHTGDRFGHIGPGVPVVWG